MNNFTVLLLNIIPLNLVPEPTQTPIKVGDTKVLFPCPTQSAQAQKPFPFSSKEKKKKKGI